MTYDRDYVIEWAINVHKLPRYCKSEYIGAGTWKITDSDDEIHFVKLTLEAQEITE